MADAPPAADDAVEAGAEAAETQDEPEQEQKGVSFADDAAVDAVAADADPREASSTLPPDAAAAAADDAGGDDAPAKGPRLKRMMTQTTRDLQGDIMPSYDEMLKVKRPYHRGISHFYRGVFTVAGLIAYWIVGIAVMCAREKWTFHHATYWSMATLIGIGYGDYAPTKPDTKIFTVFYIIVGVVGTTIATYVSAQQVLGWEYEVYEEDFTEQEDELRRAIFAQGEGQTGEGSKWDKVKGSVLGGVLKEEGGAGRKPSLGDVVVQSSKLQKRSHAVARHRHDTVQQARRKHWYHRFFNTYVSTGSLWERRAWDWQGAIASVLASILFLLVGTLFLHYVEGGPNFGSMLNSFYFTCVTMGHVGYGDFTPQKDISIWFLIFFQLFAWAYMVVVLGKAGAFQAEREHAWQMNDWGEKMEKRGEELMRVSGGIGVPPGGAMRAMNEDGKKKMGTAVHVRYVPWYVGVVSDLQCLPPCPPFPLVLPLSPSLSCT